MIEDLDNEISEKNNGDEILRMQKRLKKSTNKNIILTIFSILCIVIFLAEGVFIYYLYQLNSSFFSKKNNVVASNEYSTPSAPSKNLDMDAINQKLAYIDTLVDNMFYYDKDAKKIEDGIFSGYALGLQDKYAQYFSKEDYDSFLETQNGEYYGIGALVTQNFNTMESSVTEVYVNSPAEKAGILAGDIFKTIDGKDVTTMELSDIVSLVKGPEGSEVKIGIYRPSIDDNFEVVAIRGKVEITNVSTKTASAADSKKETPIPNNVGYMKIKEFTGKTFEQFKKTIDELENKKVNGIIIDLRDNPGGELDVVLKMIDYVVKDNDGRFTLNQDETYFDIGKTLEVYMKDRDTIIDSFYCDDGHEVTLPIVLLVNGYSASASELFTQCLMDYKKAVSVGTKTYGKGVVQDMIPLYDGSAIKFTVSGYFPPSGYEIDGKGIIPDYPITVNGQEFEYDSNGIPKKIDVSTKSNAKHATASDVKIDDSEDMQLKKAIELLK